MTTATTPDAIRDLRLLEPMPEEVNQLELVIHRFLRHKLAVISLAVLAIIVVIAIVGPSLLPFKPTDIVGDNFLAPGTKAADGVRVHYLGTDQLGRDYFTRIIYAARISLTVAFTAQILSSVIGALVGAI